MLGREDWSGIDQIVLTQDRDQWMALVNMVRNLHVVCSIVKFLSSCTIGVFSRRHQVHEVISYA
jgi:hypothetical protein